MSAQTSAIFRFKKQCTAVSAATGLRCKLLDHVASVEHRNERGPFDTVLAPGQTPERLLELANCATRQGEPLIDIVPGGKSEAKKAAGRRWYQKNRAKEAACGS